MQLLGGEHDGREGEGLLLRVHDPVGLRLEERAPARRQHGLHRIVLSTVPRSGNGWIRGLLEGATGLATESVFPEPDAIYSNRSRAYGKGCGWLNDCEHVRRSRGDEPVVVKTHFPFVTKEGIDIKGYIRRGVSDAGDASYLILAVRNPLDNYDAWMR